jgi:hypothetical protein
MATGNTTLLGLALPVEGELDGTWGDVVNDSITSLVDSAVAGTTTLSADADVTLTDTSLAANQARQAILLWTASNGATTRNITAPARSKPYIVINAGTGSVVLRGAGPTTGVTVVAGEKCLAAWNGSDFVKVSSTVISSLTGTLPVNQGGTGATTESAARTSLGATTLGASLFTVSNPSAITFPRFNADNTVSALSAADFRTATGVQTELDAKMNYGDNAVVLLSGGLSADTVAELNKTYVLTANTASSIVFNFVSSLPKGTYAIFENQATSSQTISIASGGGGTFSVQVGEAVFLYKTADAGSTGATYSKFFNPKKILNSGEAPGYVARAWVRFNGTGTVAINASGNVSSITDLGTGSYRVNFVTAMPSANYSAQITSEMGSGSGGFNGISGTPATSDFEIASYTQAGVARDVALVCAAVFN